MDFYRSILEQREYTPAMLLKMAYIEEGLQQTGRALYYLSLYYQVTKEAGVLEKMDELAAKYRLEGYARSDSDRFMTFYYDHHYKITLVLAALLVFIISFTFYVKRKSGKPLVPLIVFMFAAVGFLVHVNWGEERVSGIVGESQTYLMSGPSSGATVVGVIDGGHKVKVLGQHDVWIKIEWHGQAAYIKESSLLPLVL
jgi:hypothetical protein